MSLITPELSKLLDLIRSHEGGYNQRFAEQVPKRDLSKMTFDDVIQYGRERVTVDKKKSSAIGAYQFITTTLRSLRYDTKENFTGKELFTPEFQDRLAVILLNRRGLSYYLTGKMDAVDFANQLAMEWASLPVVSDTKGAKGPVKKGQSYYAGDGLNASYHSAAAFLAAVKALRKPTAPIPVPTLPVEPMPVTPAYEPTPIAQNPVETPTGASWYIWAILAFIIALSLYFYLR